MADLQPVSCSSPVAPPPCPEDWDEESPPACCPPGVEDDDCVKPGPGVGCCAPPPDTD
eukprot:CAMPEP_0114167248 /NCGR_PEP_ID=MMETSP0043_2-20121206/32301_1 /TAXON_ID=464988 /ORGANISM="Hemiselmis andersenii, Strain CCMP644" /LENGTH=57 /DNA_ID=CAMNT_0001264365 /DNA_START=151 /DNA_END=324 /DNA_ORIENTATION=-